MSTSTRKRWAAIGAAVAVALGGGALTFVAATGGGTASSFVPIAPCRLLDTRATSPVGPRNTPIQAAESLTVQVTGSNGSCVIPASATAIVINVTAVGPTADGYISLYPADVGLPNASNLNFSANQNPTPNLVTVSLSAGGAIKIFNAAGNVNVLGDIAGYYQPDAGTGNAGAACSVGGLAGVIVNGVDHENNVSSKCFTSLVRTLAGSTVGFTDGQGNVAQFRNPTSVAVDATGNIYVADSENNAIRKITTTGVVTTFAGDPLGTFGSAEGVGASARFHTPQGVAVDSSGNVYVADTMNNRIRKITPTGSVTTLAGQFGAGFLDDNGALAAFSAPLAVAVDLSGNVYVADSANSAIRKITPGGDVTTLAGGPDQGYVDGPGATAKFNYPQGVAVDSAGFVYVADADNNRIRKITPAGVVSTLAGSTNGYLDGTGSAAQFNLPYGVALDAAGNVYVADTLNYRIRKVSPAGVVTTFAGSTQGTADGVGTAAQFNYTRSVTFDSSGTMYVADTFSHRIRVIT